jgi:hypothetical protein
MPAGDAQRVWFPEMVETLRSDWRLGMTFEATIELRDDLDAMLQRIRSERHIRTPVFKCPQCGLVGEGAQPHVSVRAMFLSLVRFGIADAEQVKRLEKSWAVNRQQNKLDIFCKGEGLSFANIPQDAVIHKSDKATNGQTGFRCKRWLSVKWFEKPVL